MSRSEEQELLSVARRTWDIAVIGAGPAGALAAHQLASSGQSVLLVERARFPRRKVCGCCLNPRALHALAAAGLGQLPAALDAVPLRRLHLAAAGRAADIELPGGVSLSREALDTELAAAACTRGATFLQGVTASDADIAAICSSLTRSVRLRRGGVDADVRARVVLVASGLASRFLRTSDDCVTPGARLGAGAIAEHAPDAYRAGSVFMACAREGYVGLVRLEDGRLDIAAALDARALRDAGHNEQQPGGDAASHPHGVGAAAERVLAAAGLAPVPGLAQLAWHGTPALTRHARRLAAPRLFLIGDACGYVEPFTGEGIAWALASALAVTPFALAAARADLWDPRLEADWTAQWRGVVGRRQWACRVTARVLRHPALASLAVRMLAARPGLGTPVIARLARPDRWPAAAPATRA